MFNGIIFNKGLITKILKRHKGTNIFIKSDLRLGLKNIGVTVACDGVWLTLISFEKKIMDNFIKENSSKFTNDNLKFSSRLKKN